MKITGLTIRKLHGYIDYNVKFNDDITFLYGDNGCGKTTILNIMTSVITGKIYELFQYEFERIVLNYISSKTQKSDKISIVANNDTFNIEFANEVVQVDAEQFRYHYRETEDKEKIEHYYFSEYPVLGKIKDVFNYIYLPLSRSGNIIGDQPLIYRNNRPIRSKYSARNRFDITLYNVEGLVSSAYNKVNVSLNHISEKFSDDILKSFIDVDNTSNMAEVLEYMKSLDDAKITHIQHEYTNVIQNMRIWNDETEVKINAFFDSLREDISASQKQKNPEKVFELLFKLSELTKITNIIDKAEKTEQAKKKVKQPIENFINTVNGFIQSNSGTKAINIDSNGTLYLKTSQNKYVDIYNLSSGEKQIVTFFAYLIFGLKTTNQSIFIVDEPELSLHLNWQKIFVDSIVSINNNVQLIFATHAPEIIGKYRDKAVKLIPNR